MDRCQNDDLSFGSIASLSPYIGIVSIDFVVLMVAQVILVVGITGGFGSMGVIGLFHPKGC